MAAFRGRILNTQPRALAQVTRARHLRRPCVRSRACGNTDIREEQLATLLDTAVHAIQIPPAVADELASALRTSDAQADRERVEAQRRLEDRRRKVLAKIDRGYDDYVEGRVTEDFWTRKSEQDERRTIEAELARSSPRTAV